MTRLDSAIPCFNRSDDLSYLVALIRETPFQQVETVLITMAYSCISFVGVVGNGLVCLVVAKSPKMRSTRNILIANMSVANFIFAVILVPFMWLPRMQKLWNFGSLACKQVNLVASTNLFCSSFTIITCAADRYFTVSSHRHSTLSSPSSIASTAGLVVSIWLLSFAICTPFGIFYDVETTDLSAACRPDIVISTSCNLVVSKTFAYALSSVQLFCLLPLPIGCLAVFNYKLTKFLPGRRVSSVRSNRLLDARQSRATFLLVSMTVSYAVLWIPFSILVLIGDIYSDLLLESDRNGRLFEKVQVGLHMLSSLSVCVNPLLYGYFNSNFNRSFGEIWRCLLRRPGADLSPTPISHIFNRRRQGDTARLQGRREISISMKNLTDNEENDEDPNSSSGSRRKLSSQPLNE